MKIVSPARWALHAFNKLFEKRPESIRWQRENERKEKKRNCKIACTRLLVLVELAGNLFSFYLNGIRQSNGEKQEKSSKALKYLINMVGSNDRWTRCVSWFWMFFQITQKTDNQHTEDRADTQRESKAKMTVTTAQWRWRRGSNTARTTHCSQLKKT